MIHGIVQAGTILPLEPIPPDWDDGQRVVIELTADVSGDERARIEQWYADLEALGPAQYEPGEREAIEKFMADADREAKEFMRRSWARFDDALPARHQSPKRPAER
jgi:hypothetical protein